MCNAVSFFNNNLSSFISSSSHSSSMLSTNTNNYQQDPVVEHGVAAGSYWLLGIDLIHNGRERQLGRCHAGDVECHFHPIQLLRYSCEQAFRVALWYNQQLDQRLQEQLVETMQGSQEQLGKTIQGPQR